MIRTYEIIPYIVDIDGVEIERNRIFYYENDKLVLVEEFYDNDEIRIGFKLKEE